MSRLFPAPAAKQIITVFQISDDTKLLIDSAKTSASECDSTVRNVTDRLRNISQEVERITLSSNSVNTDNMIGDVEQSCEY